MFRKKEKVHYKSSDEIALIKISGDLLGRVHGEISKVIKEGISTFFLDKLAYTFINDNKAIPSFLNYCGFPYTLCISVNDTVVHGFPSEYVLKDGDIVSIDCGVFLNGFHADSAYTYRVGNVSNENYKLLKVTYDSLFVGINQAKAGLRVGDISFAVQSYCERQGYGVVRELVGHGVGKKLHEEPEVPNFGRRGNGFKLIDGTVIAIEPMINLGTKDVYHLNDNWQVKTSDGKTSAHFEHTVAISGGKPQILTTFEYIIKEQKI
jgi:methionyl aminopeptidase